MSYQICNDGSGEYVSLRDELCIGCGECITACMHDARKIIDDFDKAMDALRNRERVVAIVAPAIAAVFPDKYLNFNGLVKISRRSGDIRRQFWRGTYGKKLS